MEYATFHQAAYFAVEFEAAQNIEENTYIDSVVETHEPVDNFRPVDVMTGKMAGEEIKTPFGVIVARKAVRRGSEKQTRRMFIMRDEANDVILIGWGR